MIPLAMLSAYVIGIFVGQRIINAKCIQRLHSLWPSCGWCQRCKFPWRIVKGHHTPLSDGRKMWPLCEDCWAELGTAKKRLPYYRMLFKSWLPPESEEKWTMIEEAVRKECR